MSLWKVDDNATQALMLAFYQHWLGGMGKSQALAAAQELLRQHPNYAHPYYWGGFVLVGE